MDDSGSAVSIIKMDDSGSDSDERPPLPPKQPSLSAAAATARASSRNTGFASRILAESFKSVVQNFIESGLTCKDARLLAAYRFSSYRKCLMPHEFVGLKDLAVQFFYVESVSPMECDEPLSMAANDKEADFDESNGRDDVHNSPAAQSTIDHEEISRQWKDQGPDVIPLKFVTPEQIVKENSMRTFLAENEERLYAFDLGHDLQNFSDDDIVRLWPGNSAFMLGTKYKHARDNT